MFQYKSTEFISHRNDVLCMSWEQLFKAVCKSEMLVVTTFKGLGS